MLNHIVAVQAEPDYRLRLTYDDGQIVSADFRPVISQGGIFSPLAEPSFFSLVATDAHGRAVVWPGELEFCADALRLEWGTREPYESYPVPQRTMPGTVENAVLVEDL